MNQSLYELTGDFLSLMDMLYDEDVDEESFLEACEAIEMQIEDKADGYAKIIKSIDADVAGIDAELKRLGSRKAGLKNRQKQLKENLEGTMKAMGKTKFRTGLFSFGIQKNPPSVKVEDEPAFIAYCQRNGREVFLKYRDPEINKTELKNAILKNGEAIDGVEVAQGESLRIR